MFAMLLGVSECSHTGGIADITSIITSDASVQDKVRVNTADTVPSTPDTMVWMNQVNRHLGFEEDDKPHRLSLSSSHEMLAKISWWAQPTEDAGGNRHASLSSDMMVLSPLEHGQYTLHTYCDGTGSFTIKMTMNKEQTDKHNIACAPDMVSNLDIDMDVQRDGEQVSVRFVPTGATEAAAGFMLEKDE
ncbi:hypothetical protein [Bifidobacterium magnum]|uniref:Uncharacterized protein n=1 Tax=Bifidobacterium magnum TaxID=1692 RepID=A0A087BE10_9BIFI|nr:hypothetical protein [Bifidobacterium magnum]KFI69260.1 hypothetical protein BMAGN_1028 [Bifidobacterium magnum]